MQVKPTPSILAFHARPDHDEKYPTEKRRRRRPCPRACRRPIVRRLKGLDPCRPAGACRPLQPLSPRNWWNRRGRPDRLSIRAASPLSGLLVIRMSRRTARNRARRTPATASSRSMAKISASRRSRSDTTMMQRHARRRSWTSGMGGRPAHRLYYRDWLDPVTRVPLDLARPIRASGRPALDINPPWPGRRRNVAVNMPASASTASSRATRPAAASCASASAAPRQPSRTTVLVPRQLHETPKTFPVALDITAPERSA